MTVPQDAHQALERHRQRRARQEQRWRIEEEAAPGRKLHTTLLLELREPGLEQSFWKDDATIRAYCRSDAYTILWVLAGNLVAAKSFGAAMSLRHLAALWPVHLSLLANVVSAAASLALLLVRTAAYKRHRHRIAVGNRLLRVLLNVMAGVLRTPGAQAVMGAALKGPGGGGGAAHQRSQASVALASLARPLYWSPMMTNGQGMWVFAAKWWLPLQLVTQVVTVHCMLRFAPCRLANDPHTSLILQSTCRGFDTLNRVALGLLWGSTPLQLAPLGAADNPATCGDLLGAARLLCWYCHAAYVLLVLPFSMLGIEWRLKAAWVRRHKGAQLAYGPAGWPAAALWPRASYVFRLQRTLSYLVVFPTALALLWFAAAWLVPRLPQQPCRVACLEQPGSCPVLQPCEGWLCQNPGLWSAALLYAEILATYYINVVMLRYVVGMLQE